MECCDGATCGPARQAGQASAGVGGGGRHANATEPVPDVPAGSRRQSVVDHRRVPSRFAGRPPASTSACRRVRHASAGRVRGRRSAALRIGLSQYGALKFAGFPGDVGPKARRGCQGRLRATSNVELKGPARFRRSGRAFFLTVSRASHRPARISLRMTSAFYLAGDSYPLGRHIEVAAREGFRRVAKLWMGQAALVKGKFVPGLERRLEHLRSRLAGEDHTQVVLVGRSSGGRVVTRYTAERPVAAVVVFGYPFRQPGKRRSPAGSSISPRSVRPH